MMRSGFDKRRVLWVVVLLSLIMGLSGGEEGRADQGYRLSLPLVLKQSTKDSSFLRQRYGIIINRRSDVPETMKRLGLLWYLDYEHDVESTPPGLQRVLGVDPGAPLIPEDTIRSLVARAPGSFWMIGGEPNVKETGNQNPREYSRMLNYYDRTIRKADPSARLVGPGVLNFDYTCGGCTGYQSGHSWLDGFRAAYRDMYGTEPPLDAWSIDSYELDWESLPMVNPRIIIDQLIAFRGYLDSVPELRGKPIWLTEFGLQWGYGTIDFKDDKAYSTDVLHEPEMRQFLVKLLGWFGENAVEYRIEKWFLYASHVKIFNWASVPSGIHLINGFGPTSTLSSFGKVYHDMAQGLSVSP